MKLPCLHCGGPLAKQDTYFCSATCGLQYALDAIGSSTPPLYVPCRVCGKRWSKCGDVMCEVCGPPPKPLKRMGCRPTFEERRRKARGER